MVGNTEVIAVYVFREAVIIERNEMSPAGAAAPCTPAAAAAACYRQTHLNLNARRELIHIHKHFNVKRIFYTYTARNRLVANHIYDSFIKTVCCWETNELN